MQLVSVRSNRMKLIVCESCEAEFNIKHHLEPRLYKIEFCPFCGDELNEELEDELEDENYGEDYDE
mgnify:CR=1 FL=1